MNIAIDIRSTLKAQTTGIGYYTLNLIRHLSRIDTQNKYNLYCRRRLLSRKKILPDLPGANFRHMVNFLGLPDKWFLRDLDVYHSSSYDILPQGKVKKVITVHDLIPKISQTTTQNWHPNQVIKEFDRLIKTVLAEADKIIVTSNNTKKDLLEYYSYDPEKIAVIPMGVDRLFKPAAVEQKDILYKDLKLRYNIPASFLLYIGTIEPRKNIKCLIKAYNLLKQDKDTVPRLVICGMKGWMYEDVFNLVKNFNLEQDIIFTGYVPDEDIKIFYKLAQVFIYPSLYEGFGLPLLEAMASGTPVVTTASGALAEVAGPAARLADTTRPEPLAKCISRVLEDSPLAQELIKKGLLRAKEFTWEKTADKTLAVYEQVVG
ncbi:MAG: glycosyltransferase family 4 protein [Candidatus Omnitrophica bacterium]|nr:glycosyltransferase family 4 protein [Candidatus Omnitrophota bacterium]